MAAVLYGIRSPILSQNIRDWFKGKNRRMHATDSGTFGGTQFFAQQGGDGVVHDFAGSVILAAG